MIRKYKSKKIERGNIGALWEREAQKDGKPYFLGRIEIAGATIEIVVFKNEFKEKFAQPDYVIRIQNKINKDETDTETT